MPKDPYLYLSNVELEMLEIEKKRELLSMREIANLQSDSRFLEESMRLFGCVESQHVEKKKRQTLQFKIRRAIIRKLVTMGVIKY